jgi:hypothetical protein
MTFRSVGTNLSGLYTAGVRGLTEDLKALKRSGPDFVEVWPQNLGVILGGGLDTNRLRSESRCLKRSWPTRSMPRWRSTSWT